MKPLEVMLGSYPHTEPLKSGQVRSDRIHLNIAGVASAPSAFKQVVELKYDVAELSVPTFLIARSKGVPLSLLPADLFKRAKPPELVYDATRGAVTAADLGGKRIGVGYYTATTSIWMQCLIGNAGVDPRDIRWVAIDPPLVAGFQDPAYVQRVSGMTLLQLLEGGDVDAVVMPSAPAEAKYGAVSFASAELRPTNPFPDIESHHMLVCRTALTKDSPDVVGEVWRLLLEARALAVKPGSRELPFSVDANRAHLDAVIEACFKLRLIDNRPSVDELFDEVATTLPISK